MKKINKKYLIQLLLLFILPLFLLPCLAIFSSCRLSGIFSEQTNEASGTAITEITAKSSLQENLPATDNPEEPGPGTNMENSKIPEDSDSALEKEISAFLKNQSGAMLESAIDVLDGLEKLPFYEIGLDIDFANSSYCGRQKVYFTNLEDRAFEKIYLRLFPNSGNVYGNGSLDILPGIYINSKAVNTAKIKKLNDGSDLEILLPEELLPGQSITLELNFKGVAPMDFAEGSYGFFNRTENTLCLSGWFPILAVFDSGGWNLDPSSMIGDSVYSDMAFYSVNVCADSDLKIISTGVLSSSGEMPGQEKAVHNFISGPVRDFIIVAGMDHNSISSAYGDVKLNCHYFENGEPKAQKSLESAIKAFEVFEDKFGKYPYREFDIVEIPLKNVQGIEFPQLILLNSSVFGDESVLAHEIAHQWWYNIVGNDPIDNPWMDEALATYCQVIFLEETKGQKYAQGMIDYLKRTYEAAVTGGKDDIVSESLEYFEPKGSRHYSIIVYYKGALFLDQVRKSIGDEAFFGALKTYYELKKYKVAGPEDMLLAFESESGKELDWLFDEWLY